MSKLPYDDEQSLDQDTLDLINGDNVDEVSQEDNYKNPATLKYFTNDQSALQPDPQVDLSGQMVGQSRMPTARDPFQRLNELVPQQTEVQPESSTQETKVNPQLSSYQNILKQLQDKRKDNNLTVNMARAGNQIAQALASGYGAKIGDGSDTLNAIQKSNEQDIADYHEQISNQSDDPNSDISKFAKEQAVVAMQRLNPKMTPEQIDNLRNNFNNMSAKQLEQLGFKGVSGLNKSLTNHAISPVRGMMTADGHPIGTDVNPGTEGGRLVDLMTGKQIQPNTKLVNQIPKVDPITGEITYVSPESVNNKAASTTVNPDGSTKFQPTVAQRKALEIQGKQFDKQVTAPMQQLRDANSLVEELASNNKLQIPAVRDRIAKIAKGAGALTVYDEQSFGGSKALADQLEQYIQTQTDSTFTPENRKAFSELLKTFTKQSNEAFDSTKNKFSDRLALNYNIPNEFSDKYFGNKPLVHDNKKPDKTELDKVQKLLQSPNVSDDTKKALKAKYGL